MNDIFIEEDELDYLQIKEGGLPELWISENGLDYIKVKGKVKASFTENNGIKSIKEFFFRTYSGCGFIPEMLDIDPEETNKSPIFTKYIDIDSEVYFNKTIPYPEHCGYEYTQFLCYLESIC